MPYRRSRSRYWYITYTDASGKRIRESSGTSDRREAEEIERRRRSEAWAQAKLGQSPDRAVEEVLVEYLRHLGDSKSGERARYAVKPIYQFFKGQATIQPDQIVAYRNWRDRAESTIRKELSTLSSAYNYVRRELGWQIDNPIAGRLGERPEGRVRWITKAEAERLLEAARANKRAPHLWPFIQLGLYTGMRRGEMLGLEWARVDLDAGLAYLRPSDQKGRRYDSVALNQKARAALAALGGHDRWVFAYRGRRVQSVRKSFDRAVRAAGIEDFHIHDMRHTCAAWLVQKGVPLRDVADVLRHRDIATTMNYSHLAPDSAKRAVSALDDV